MISIQKLRDMNLNSVADELESLRAFKAEVESQDPVASVKSINRHGDIDIVAVDDTLRVGDSLYVKPVPADKPAVAVPDAEAAFEVFAATLGGVDTDAYHDYPADGLFIKGFEAGIAAAPSHSQQSAQGTTSAASREDEMVVIERDSAGTPTVWCDPEIVDLVTALNKAGIRTVASCSGHGYRPGNIALADGRELVIARTFEEAREIDQLFLTDINGDRCPSHDSEHGDNA